MEFKCAERAENVSKKLEEAVSQLNEENYRLQRRDAEIIRFVLVFSLEKREYVEWKAFRSVWWNLLTKISSARLIEKKHCNWKEIFLLGLNCRKPFVYIRSKPVNTGGRFIQKHFGVWKETCWIYFLFRLLKPFHCGIISSRLNVHSVFYFFSTLLACYEKGRHFIRY